MTYSFIVTSVINVDFRVDIGDFGFVAGHFEHAVRICTGLVHFHVFDWKMKVFKI